MSKGKAAFGIVGAISLGILNGFWVFDPAFRQLKQEKEGEFAKRHADVVGDREEGGVSIPSQSQTPIPEPTINTKDNRINNEPKILNDISTQPNKEGIGGKEMEKSSWWRGMSIWARDEKSEEDKKSGKK